MWVFLNMNVLQGGVVSTSPNPQAGRTTPCRLSATAHPIYSQLPSISEVVPLSATWGHAMPLWQGPTTWCLLLLITGNKIVLVFQGKIINRPFVQNAWILYASFDSVTLIIALSFVVPPPSYCRKIFEVVYLSIPEVYLELGYVRLLTFP